MILTLSSYSKTVPSNYDRTGMELLPDIAPGDTCTDDQWDKAKRMEDPHYDWSGYTATTVPKGDHPEYVARAKHAELVDHWEAILKVKEPMRRGP